MSISVTKNNTQNNFNPLKWTACGAAAGYIAKDVLPLSKSEKEYYQFDQFLIDRKSSVKNAVEQELEAIREIIKSGTQDKGFETYLEYVKIAKQPDAKEKFLNNLAALPENAQATFNRLKSQVDNKVKELKKSHNFMYESAIKRLRPVSGYVIVGAILGTGIAFVSYVLSKMFSPKA